MTPPDLTILLPAFNEEEGLARAIDAAIEAGEALVSGGEIGSFEVLVVDDASTDATPEIARRYVDLRPEVRTIRHPVNRRLGGSIRTGLAAARGAVVLYTDADLPFDLLELGKAFRLMRHYDADIVTAYRHDRTGEGPRRLVYSHLYNRLVHLVTGLRLRDVNFAGKLVRRAVVEAVDLRSEGSFIDVELLAKAERQGFRIIQFGVDYFPRTRGISTLSSPAVIGTMLREMVVLLPEIRRTRRRGEARRARPATPR